MTENRNNISSWQHEQNVSKVVGATLSDGYLVIIILIILLLEPGRQTYFGAI